jgi:hypothetical protein
VKADCWHMHITKPTWPITIYNMKITPFVICPPTVNSTISYQSPNIHQLVSMIIKMSRFYASVFFICFILSSLLWSPGFFKLIQEKIKFQTKLLPHQRVVCFMSKLSVLHSFKGYCDLHCNICTSWLYSLLHFSAWYSQFHSYIILLKQCKTKLLVSQFICRLLTAIWLKMH